MVSNSVFRIKCPKRFLRSLNQELHQEFQNFNRQNFQFKNERAQLRFCVKRTPITHSSISSFLHCCSAKCQYNPSKRNPCVKNELETEINQGPSMKIQVIIKKTIFWLFFFQANLLDREAKLKKIHEKIIASQAAKKPGECKIYS